MRINELSKLTGINKETIRSYRKKGFLHPERDENGYYNYNKEDVISLLYVGKMRREGFSLENIEAFYHSDDHEDLAGVYAEAEKKILDQIEALKRSLRFMEFERRHMHECFDGNVSSVIEMQSIDEKVDFYGLFHHEIDLNLADILQMTTPSILIPKEILNGEISDRVIPIQVGIGTYRYLINEKHIPVPEDVVIVPNGICLSQILAISDLNEINIMDIAPMMQYAKDHGRTFLSDTTGYLVRTEYRDGKYVFYFRIRACVEENTVKDTGIR